MRGRIIRISKTGWGFISSKEIEFTRIFFHWTELREESVPFLELRVGMIVDFTPIQFPDKRWRAINIKAFPKSETPYEESNNLPSLQE